MKTTKCLVTDLIGDVLDLLTKRKKKGYKMLFRKLKERNERRPKYTM